MNSGVCARLLIEHLLPSGGALASSSSRIDVASASHAAAITARPRLASGQSAPHPEAPRITSARIASFVMTFMGASFRSAVHLGTPCSFLPVSANERLHL